MKELLSAEQAFKRSKQVQTHNQEEILTVVIDAIESANVIGEFTTPDLQSKIPYDKFKWLNSVLTEKGYTVNSGSNQMDGSWFIVSWGANL